MMCYFLLNNEVNQLYYVCPLPLKPPSTPSISPLCVITGHQAEIIVLHSGFPLAVSYMVVSKEEPKCLADRLDAGNEEGRFMSV